MRINWLKIPSTCPK
jgi:hypothetical protein